LGGHVVPAHKDLITISVFSIDGNVANVFKPLAALGDLAVTSTVYHFVVRHLIFDVKSQTSMRSALVSNKNMRSYILYKTREFPEIKNNMSEASYNSNHHMGSVFEAILGLHRWLIECYADTDPKLADKIRTGFSNIMNGYVDFVCDQLGIKRKDNYKRLGSPNSYESLM